VIVLLQDLSANLFTHPDAFFAKFDSNGVRQWGTYYGEKWMTLLSCTTDSSGNVYFTGLLHADNMLVLVHFRQYGGGSGDAFLVKFTTGAKEYGQHTMGESDDGVTGCIATDRDICMVGSSTSLSGIASPGLSTVFGGLKDGLVVKFDSSVKRLMGYLLRR